MVASVCLYVIKNVRSVMVNPYIQLLSCETHVLFFTL